MNNGGYPDMTIHSYKEIVTCKSYGYAGLKYLHP